MATLVNAFPNPRAPKPVLAKKARSYKPKGHFRFLDLPFELRLRIYEYALIEPGIIDLDPKNYRKVAPRLNMFLTCRRIHEEACPVFFGGHTFRIFPVYYEYLDDKKDKIPILAQLLGQSATMLDVNGNLGLRDCTSLRTLTIFIECDPSHPVFHGFSISPTFYTDFCGNLFEGILKQMPSIHYVEFDAWESVTRDSPLLKELLGQAEDAEKKIIWGPLIRCNEELLVSHNEEHDKAFGDDIDASERELNVVLQGTDLNVSYIMVH